MLLARVDDKSTSVSLCIYVYQCVYLCVCVSMYINVSICVSVYVRTRVCMMKSFLR